MKALVFVGEPKGSGLIVLIDQERDPEKGTQLNKTFRLIELRHLFRSNPARRDVWRCC